MDFFETLGPIIIWLAIGLVALTLLALVIFGIRGLFYGKAEPFAVVTVLVPIVLLVVLGFIFQGGDTSQAEAWAQAGIWTVVVMFSLGILGLLYSGIRGAIS